MEKFGKNYQKIYYNMVVAISKNKGIGYQGKLPWELPMDMAHFKTITTKTFNESDDKFEFSSQNFINNSKNLFRGNIGITNNKTNLKNMVVMGRSTWESIPLKFRPLKERINVVFSKNEDFKLKNPEQEGNFYSLNNIESFLDLASNLQKKELINEIYIIGGVKIYNEFFNKYPDLCKLIFLTNISKEYPCDVFFDLPTNFKPIHISKTFTDPKDKNELKATFDFRVLINENIKKDEFLMNNFDKVINPYFLKQYPKHEELQYLDILSDIIDNGVFKQDRTGTGTVSKFGASMRFDCSETFPLLTTKDTFWRGIVEELLWFIKGDTNAKHLQEKKVHIWDGNASKEYLNSIGLIDREEGDLGPVYGFQWRHSGAEYKTMNDDYTGQGVDQLLEVIEQIKKNPNSRRIIISAWNPKDLKLMALPPCHVFCQFYVLEGKLNLQMYQRSADMGLGVPFNIASYALLLRMVAHVTGLKPGEFIHTIGDAHIYKNHIDPIKLQLTRDPKPFPILKINKDIKNILDFSIKDFTLENYTHWPKIKMEMAV